jgi:hypothetical protein
VAGSLVQSYGVAVLPSQLAQSSRRYRSCRNERWDFSYSIRVSRMAKNFSDTQSRILGMSDVM